MKATKRILYNGQLIFKDRLRRLDILLLSFYHELHVPLLILDIVKCRYNIEWRNFIQVTKQNDPNSKTGNTRRFKTRNLSRQKKKSNFRKRGVYITNLIGQKVGQSVDFLPAASRKKKITEVYTNSFTEVYDPENVCT